ncbi:Peptidyl-prolyl isomerase cwc27 [Eufriesea mexicana]|uniref:Peptidyl-prolyl isomerase cwc27 n=1 Tax=Eufriesea mexicana TaxID=516756 RepID=A0A310SNV6_9HYME|nr:Peptidyl-prolyl isomerase cwc27 [Eufriesea mexicana]
MSNDISSINILRSLTGPKLKKNQPTPSTPVENDVAEMYKEKRQVRVKALRRENAYYVESRNRKGAAYISTEKDVWHEHTDTRIIEEMENEHLVIVIKIKDELNIECKCFIKDIMKTTVGGVELELWAKETPKACKNFIKLCTGEGGKIYGEPFKNGRPLYPPRLLKTIILNNPFSDIIPRIIAQESEEVKYNSKTKTAAVKDFNLLSFGEEAKEDEEESVILNKKFIGTDKSVHDHLTDPN